MDNTRIIVVDDACWPEVCQSSNADRVRMSYKGSEMKCHYNNANGLQSKGIDRALHYLGHGIYRDLCPAQVAPRSREHRV